MKKEMILQINVPLCVRRCAHCGQVICKYEPKLAAAYAKALLREIEIVVPDLFDYEISAISIEGGSPALLESGDLQAILRAARRSFSLADDVQIAIQTMPGDYSRALMEKLRDSGVNFWIVGLATADMREHELLRRPYRYDALTMVDMAIRTFNPRALSFDLLYGIPNQTAKTWAHTLDTALSYQPEHLTLLPLDLSVNSALKADCDNGLIEPMPPKQVEALRQYAHERLTALGYMGDGRADYALPGQSYRFRQKQRDGVEQLGLGYRAVTAMDGYRYVNGHSLNEYLAHPGELEVLAAEVEAMGE